MENNELPFLSQVKAHHKKLFSGIGSTVLLYVLALFLASKSGNVKTLATVSSEAQTPLTFAIVFMLAAFLLVCSFLVSFFQKKSIYNKFFFCIFNILLVLSISNIVVRLFVWDVSDIYFRKIHPYLTFLDVLDFTALPILLLMFHAFVDLFHPRNYSFKDEPHSYVLYLMFVLPLGIFYIVFFMLCLIVLINLF